MSLLLIDISVFRTWTFVQGLSEDHKACSVSVEN